MLIQYTIASKIVMLRDFKLAAKAIQRQKQRVQSSYQKFYRGMKMMNRSVDLRLNSWYVKKSTKPIHKLQIESVFQK